MEKDATLFAAAIAPDQSFSRQITWEGGTIAAHCAVCGKTERARPLLARFPEGAMSRLRLRFNQCPACGRWVCDDCFCMNTGPDGAGLCGECNAQFFIEGEEYDL